MKQNEPNWDRRPAGRRLIKLALFGWLAIARAPAAPPSIPDDVKTYVRALVADGYCPGIVVGLLTTNGAAYYSCGQGSLDSPSPVDEDSVFEIGSITKTFTGTLLSQMELAGDLAVSDPIQPSLPASVHVPMRDGIAITFQHLATHTSGLPRLPTNFAPADWLNPYADYTVQDMYDFLSGYVLPRDPGSQWEYSNYGMGLLGHILGLRAGLDYETLVRERITDPLGLTNTGIALTESMSNHLALGHTGVIDLPNWDLGALPGAGALRSTARDLLTYAGMNAGIIPSPLYRAMTNAHRIRSTVGGTLQGLAWMSQYTSSGDLAVLHDGATGGYNAMVGFLPSRHLAAVVLANSDYSAVLAAYHLLDSGFALTPPTAPATVPVATLQRCVGHYVNDAYAFDISLYRGHLTCKYSSDASAYTLFPSAPMVFYLTVVTAACTFSNDAAGLVPSLTWSQGGYDTPFQRARGPSLLQLQWTTAGPSLTLTGDADRRFALQTSPDGTSWTNLSTNTIWDGPITDFSARNHPVRLYRLKAL